MSWGDVGAKVAVFPAHAGVILLAVARNFFIGGLSRTRGGDPLEGKPLRKHEQSFPHTRG